MSFSTVPVSSPTNEPVPAFRACPSDIPFLFLLVWGVVTVVVQILDAVVPVWGTKVMGGSKAGVWGSTIGLVAGLFLGPWGIVLGPFVGAVAGEILANRSENGMSLGQALKAGTGSFVGLLTGTVLKLICVGLMIYYFVAAVV